MGVYHVYAWFLQRPEEDFGFLGFGVTSSFESSCSCRETSMDPLEELSELLTDEQFFFSPV